MPPKQLHRLVGQSRAALPAVWVGPAPPDDRMVPGEDGLQRGRLTW
jgi:hypothetical protein